MTGTTAKVLCVLIAGTVVAVVFSTLFPRQNVADPPQAIYRGLPTVYWRHAIQDLRTGPPYGDSGPLYDDAEGLPVLLELLEDQDSYVRAYAARGIGRLGSSGIRALPALAEKLGDEAGLERGFAVDDESTIAILRVSEESRWCAHIVALGTVTNGWSVAASELGAFVKKEDGGFRRLRIDLPRNEWAEAEYVSRPWVWTGTESFTGRRKSPK